MDLTEAFAPGGGGEDLPKTDFFDFVVSPPPHCTSADGVSDEESFLHRTTCRSIGYLQQAHEDHDAARDLHTSSPFIKETNNNTLTALPPVSTITGSLSHHHHHHNNHQHHNNHHIRSHHNNVQSQSNDQVSAMDQSDCDYWGNDDNKEQTCSILLEDLSKYCWSANQANDTVSVHQSAGVGRGCNSNDRQNTDGAIYTLTVLNNEANSMDALDCCKSPTPASSDSWSLRPNLDLDAILSMEPSSGEQEQEQHNTIAEVSRSINDRYHSDRFSVSAGSQYTTDDSGFVESKELCARAPSANTSCGGGDNNNDWKLSDQNLQEAAAVAVVSGDSAESLLRSALQGKLYTGAAQVVSSSSTTPQPSMSLSVVTSNNGLQLVADQPQPRQSQPQSQTPQQPQSQPQQQSQTQQPPDEPMHTCTDEDLLLSQLDQTAYRPGDYEKLKSIANEVVESYCSLEPVCNVSATTTVMYTLDPTSGSLGTITLPADLGQVSAVTVVTAPQQDVLQQHTARSNEIEAQQQQPLPPVKTKAPKKYCRRNNKNNNNNNNNNIASNGNASNDSGGSGNQQSSGSGGSPGSVQRKERSLHYCSICSKGFKDKYSVNVHIRTHTGEKPFACSLCGKSFRQKAHLAKHYQTHVTQKAPNIQQQSQPQPATTVVAAAAAAGGGGVVTGGSNGGSSNNGNSNSGNPSPSAETTPTSATSPLSSRSHQVTLDPTGITCNPPS